MMEIVTAQPQQFTQSSPVAIALALVLILAFLGWLVYIFIWILKKLGFFRFFKFKKLKRKFKNTDYEFDDEILTLCRKFISQKYKYKHIKLLTKTHAKKDEILYTYLWMKKLKGGI